LQGKSQGDSTSGGLHLAMGVRQPRHKALTATGGCQYDLDFPWVQAGVED